MLPVAYAVGGADPGLRRRADPGRPDRPHHLVLSPPCGPQYAGRAMTIDLGIPTMPPPTLAARRPTRKIKVGKVEVGGDAPVSVQSMTTTLTSDINATLQQIAELTATGCDIVRVAVPSQDDADALPAIATKSQIPVIADIHFQPKYVYRGHRRRLRRGPGQSRQHQGVRRPGQGDRQGGGGSRHLDPHRGERGVARQAAAGQVRQGHPGGARRVGALGGQPLRGARLPRLQDLGEAQRPGGDGPGVRVAERGLRLPAAPRRHRGRARRSRAPSNRRSRSEPCSARGSATRSGSRSRHRRSRRSRSGSRSCSRSTCGPASWRSCPAHRAAAPRSTSTSWPMPSPPASKDSRFRCGSP